MFDLLHDFYLRLDIFQVVMIGKYFLIDDFDSNGIVVGDQSTKEDFSICTLPQRFLQSNDILLYFLLAVIEVGLF